MHVHACRSPCCCLFLSVMIPGLGMIYSACNGIGDAKKDTTLACLGTAVTLIWLLSLVTLPFHFQFMVPLVLHWASIYHGVLVYRKSKAKPVLLSVREQRIEMYDAKRKAMTQVNSSAVPEPEKLMNTKKPPKFIRQKRTTLVSTPSKIKPTGKKPILVDSVTMLQSRTEKS